MEVSPLDERKKESIIFWQTCTTFARKHNNGSWRGNLPCSGVYRCARFQQWNATLVVRYAHFLGVHRPIRNTVYNPRCSKLLHTRRGEERWSPLVHTSPTSLVYIIYRTYTFACIHICGVLTIPGPENLQGSIALPPDCARTSLTDAATEEGTLFLFSSLAGFSLRTAPSGIIGEYCFEKYASRLVFYKSRFVSEMRAWEINVTISSSYLCRPVSVPRAITPSNNEGKSFSKKFVSSVSPRAFLPFVLIINRCFGARVSVSRNIKGSGEKRK